MRHTLKIEDVHYENIMAGLKEFEVRFNDRDYQRNDEIEFTSVSGVLKREGLWKIKHVHSGYGMADNFVILGIEALDAITASEKIASGNGIITPREEE